MQLGLGIDQRSHHGSVAFFDLSHQTVNADIAFSLLFRHCFVFFQSIQKTAVVLRLPVIFFRKTVKIFLQLLKAFLQRIYIVPYHFQHGGRVQSVDYGLHLSVRLHHRLQILLCNLHAVVP